MKLLVVAVLVAGIVSTIALAQRGHLTFWYFPHNCGGRC